MSKLRVSKLRVSKLCVDKLFVSKLCVDKLEEEAAGGGGGVGGGGGAEGEGIQNQKQEPHTKMWGNIVASKESAVASAVRCCQVFSIWRLC